MIVPIVCYTENCPNQGQLINEVPDIPPLDVDEFFEGYDGGEAEDWCPFCRQLGVAEDPFTQYRWEAHLIRAGLVPNMTIDAE